MTETGIDVVSPSTKKDELSVFDFIETFYKPRRHHTALSPKSRLWRSN